MDERSALIRKLLVEWLRHHYPHLLEGDWARIVPSDELGISRERWQLETRDLLRILQSELGAPKLLHIARIGPFRGRPLGEFASYLDALVKTRGNAGSHFDADAHVRSRGRPIGSASPYFEADDVFARRINRQEQSGGQYAVWFGTNREPNDPGDGAKGFSSRRSSATRYGRCVVHVPKSHRIGSIGSSLIRRLATGVDDRLTVQQIEALEATQLWRGLQDAIDAAPHARRHSVILIHGYNTSFETAALQAAQIGFDLSIEAMAFFSWPSRGTALGYLADSATIEASEPAITDFLAAFAERVETDAIHIIAHSMGNRGVLRAVNRIAERASSRTRKPFKQIVLAAADVDADTFKAFSKAYGEVAERTTLYTSARDLALRASKMLADFPRVGFWPPVMVLPDIETISVSKLDLTGIGHGYIADARPILSDLHQLLFTGLPAADRFGTEPQRNDDGERYWSIRG